MAISSTIKNPSIALLKLEAVADRPNGSIYIVIFLELPLLFKATLFIALIAKFGAKNPVEL